MHVTRANRIFVLVSEIVSNAFVALIRAVRIEDSSFSIAYEQSGSNEIQITNENGCFFGAREGAKIDVFRKNGQRKPL